MRRPVRSKAWTSLALAGAVAASLAADGAARAQGGDAAQPAPEVTGPQPFGANLFLGNFRQRREDGLNPGYVVAPGDQVSVNTWGAVEINQVFVVDGQGNIFLPGIGPVQLGGVTNSALTLQVKRAIAKVYRQNFDVYTNLLTAAPVAVFVTGGVVRPGRYAGVPSDSVLFFLDQAGGIDSTLGSYRDIVVLRGDKEIAAIDLYDFILSGELPIVQLADEDTILVRRRGAVVTVAGQVAVPAVLEFTKAPITGADALRIMPKAARATEVTLEGVRAGRPFQQTLTVAELETTELRDGDTVQFRDDRQLETMIIKLQGEFKGPAELSVLRGSRLVDLLNYIEVDPELSDLASVHIRRPSVARAQKKSIDDSLFRLERSALLALSATQNEAAIRVKEAELMRSFIESARLIQPLGRVATSVHGEPLNILLNDGDTIVIPPKDNVVRVSGEVQVAQAVVYSGKLRARDYIRLAGGYTERSRQDKVIILHASAEVTVGGPNALVRAGDEILVPPRVDRKLLQNAADITQVIYQIAVAAAVVLAI